MSEHTAACSPRSSIGLLVLRLWAPRAYRVQVELPRCVVGSGPQAQLRIAHPQIKPQHCEFYWHQSQLWLRSLEAEVLFRGKPVRQVLVYPGQVFYLGPVRLEVLAVGQRFPAQSSHQPPDGKAEGSSAQAAEATEPGWVRRLEHLEKLCHTLRQEENLLEEIQQRLDQIDGRLRDLTDSGPETVDRSLHELLRAQTARLVRRLRKLQQRQCESQAAIERRLHELASRLEQLQESYRQLQTAQEENSQHLQSLRHRLDTREQTSPMHESQEGLDQLREQLQHLTHHLEHLERRWGELEQRVRTWWRELRGEVHTEVESRLAGLRAEREALERQAHAAREGSSSRGIALAPGVGFPPPKPATADAHHQADEPDDEHDPSGPSSASQPEQHLAATQPSEDQAPDCQEREQPEVQTESASDQGATAGEQRPLSADLLSDEEATPSPNQSEIAQEPADSSSEAALSKSEEIPSPAAAEASAQPTDSQSPEDTVSQEGAAGCSLSTVELFRRLGIEVPGLDEIASENPPQQSALVSQRQEQTTSAAEQVGSEDNQPEGEADSKPVSLSSSKELSHQEEAPLPSQSAQHEAPQTTAPLANPAEAVEEYMAQLLESVQAEQLSSSQEQPTPGESQKTVGESRELKQEVPTPEMPNAPGSLPGRLAPCGLEPDRHSRSIESPEALHTLRRLANHSARRAIATYQRRMKLNATQTKLLISVMAMAASFALMWFASSLPHVWTDAAAVCSLVVSVYYGLRYLALTAQEPGGSEEELASEERTQERPSA